MIRRNMLTLVCGILIGLISAPSHAQMRTVHAPNRAHVDQRVSVYATWDGSRPLVGALLALPSSWTLVTMRAISPDGSTQQARLRRIPQIPGRYQASWPTPVLEDARIQIQIRTGSSTVDGRWALVPEVLDEERGERPERVLREDLRIGASLAVVASGRSENSALLLSPNTPAVTLRGDALPDLSSERAFSLEGWIRTSEVDGVLMSSWDGNEESPYSLELLIDEKGEAVFYQGQPGDHRAVRSGEPVADGTWHHVAVLHDPARGWTKMLVDGISTDSIYSAVPISAPRPDYVVLGRRVGETAPPTLAVEIDQLRFWAVARDPAAVRNGMRRPLPQPLWGATFLEFEEPSLPAEYGMSGERLVLVPSQLEFREPLGDISIRVENDDVILTFAAGESLAEAVIVERSFDGRSFTPVGGSIPIDEVRQRIEFRDYGASGRAAFYRVRERLTDGRERLSQTVKVGAGDTSPQWTARLEGNFPNPFNPSTTVSYSLDEAQIVSVSVWDLAGQQVRSLWEGAQSEGDHQVVFDAGELPSGVYFVRLRSNQGVQSHRMLLTK